MGTGKRPTATATIEPSLYEVDLELWARGELGFLIRDCHQRELYRAVRGWEAFAPGDPGPIVINSHRKMGKSYCLDLLAWERALRRPWEEIIYLAPTFAQGRKYLFDLHRQIEAICPPVLRPEWSGDKLVFRNPYWGIDGRAQSTIQLIGVKDPDAARGPRATMIIGDEVREWKRLDYMHDDILTYCLVGAENPLIVYSTTPPASMAHPFVTRFIPEAISRGTYFLLPLDDVKETYRPYWENRPVRGRRNTSVPAETRAMLEKQCRGRKSVAYKREALCKLLSDPKELIVPEFQRVRHHIVKEVRVPKYFNAYTGIDFGWSDHNGAIFAVVDFLQRKIKVLAELWRRNASTGWLARNIRRVEKALWSAKGGPAAFVDGSGRWKYKNLMRVGDHSKQQLADLWMDHDIFVAEADKWDKMAHLSQMRQAIADGTIEIHPRCVQLINQLANGTWKPTPDGARKDFIRDGVLGHCDLIDALLYLHRKADLEDNPIPRRRIDDSREFQVLPDELEAVDIELQTIRIEPIDEETAFA